MRQIDKPARRIAPLSMAEIGRRDQQHQEKQATLAIVQRQQPGAATTTLTAQLQPGGGLCRCR